MSFKLITKQRKYILIAAIIGNISLFLPWVNISIFSVAKTVNVMQSSTGYFFFILFSACGIIAFAGKLTENISKNAKIAIIVCSLIALIWLLLILILSFNSISTGVLHYGFYITLLATIGIIFFALKYYSSGQASKYK